MSGSYGTAGKPQPDPKQPVTSMDTAAEEAVAAAADAARNEGAEDGPAATGRA